LHPLLVGDIEVRTKEFAATKRITPRTLSQHSCNGIASN
jgi:hypothetical protein